MSFAEPTTLGIGIAAAGAIAFGVWYFRRRKRKEKELRSQQNIWPLALRDIVLFLFIGLYVCILPKLVWEEDT